MDATSSSTFSWAALASIASRTHSPMWSSRISTPAEAWAAVRELGLPRRRLSDPIWGVVLHEKLCQCPRDRLARLYLNKQPQARRVDLEEDVLSVGRAPHVDSTKHQP